MATDNGRDGKKFGRPLAGDPPPVDMGAVPEGAERVPDREERRPQPPREQSREYPGAPKAERGMPTAGESWAPPVPRAPTSLQFGTVDPAMLMAVESVKVRIQSAYMVAMQKPRDRDEARQNILRECRRPAFAKDVQYRRPQGRKKEGDRWVDNYVTGPSVRFAEVAMSEWGNIWTESVCTFDGDDMRRVRVWCLDLESNVSHTKELVIPKTVERRAGRDGGPPEGREALGKRTNSSGLVVYIVRATDEEVRQAEARLISMAIRNEGLRLIPQEVVDEGMLEAGATMARRDSEDPDGSTRNMLASFEAMGVRVADLREFLGHTVGILSPRELEVLRGVYSSMNEGSLSWHEVVAAKTAEADAVREKSQNKIDKLKKDLDSRKK